VSSRAEPKTRRTRPFYLVLLTAALLDCRRPKKTVTLTAGVPIAVAAPRAYITNNGSDSVSVIARDGDAVTTVPVDVDPDAHEAPHHLAVDGASAFVALAFPPQARKGAHASHGGAADAGKLVRLDLATLAVRETVDVDENPGDVILTHDRTRLLVTHFDMKRAMDVAARGAASPSAMFAQLVVVDAKSMKRLGARAICTAPHGVATTRDDRTAFVACYGSDELALVDLASPGFPTTRVPLGAAPGVPGVPRYGPYSATLSPDEAHVVVANLESRDIRVLDRATKSFGSPIALGARAFMPAFVDASTLFVPTQAPDGLAVVDVTKGTVLARAPIERAACRLPHVVAVAPDGRVYLVCEGDHTGPGAVLEIDRATLATKRRWAVGVAPDGIAFD